MNRLVLPLVALCLAGALRADPVAIEAPLPPAPAWHGASERLVAPPGDPWITPAEAAGFETTPGYADTRLFVDRLVAASPLLRIESFGRTAEGRELYAVVASRGDGRRRPLLLAQAGIHAGEIDGKDAGLMLLRDIALRGKDGLLDRADFVLVPIFNADGHERSSAYQSPEPARTPIAGLAHDRPEPQSQPRLSEAGFARDARDDRFHPPHRSDALPRPARHRRRRLSIRHHLRPSTAGRAAMPSRRRSDAGSTATTGLPRTGRSPAPAIFRVR